MNIVAVIQARMGSSRLPGKVMLPLPGGYSVLETIVKRVSSAKSVNRVVVATSRNSTDATIYDICHANGIPCFRGSEEDVLDRVYQAAVFHCADLVVDITADCPLVDPRHIDRLVYEFDVSSEKHSSGSKLPDYVSNCFYRDWPDGLDIQVYSIDALKRVWLNNLSVREHVGWNIPKQAEYHGFLIRQPLAPDKYHRPEWGLTLDEPMDYTLIRRLFADAILAFGDIKFPVEWVLEELIKNQQLLEINSTVKRKEPGKC